MNQHQPITREAFSGAVLFDTAEQFFDALLGPRQHDAHVREFKIERGEIQLTPWQASVRQAKRERAAR